jgi:tetratricopeptide (TPR) repeat protein
MRRRELAILFLLVVPGLIGCGGQGVQRMSAGAVYEQAQETLDTLDNPQEKVAIFEEFVRAYPDSEEAIDALGAVIYLRSKKLDDPDGAVLFAEAARSMASDPKTRFEDGIMLHDISLQAGNPVDLRMIADELAAARPLNFVEHLSVVEEAEKAGAWEVMLEHSTSMGQFANAETFRSDYPDDDFSDERVEFSVKRRRGWASAYEGAALIHLDRLDEASAVFEEAADLSALSNYVGVPEIPLNRYWGKAELLHGRPDRAAELLAADALIGRDDAALVDLKAAYVATNGSEEGFESYALAVRQSIATVIDDVTLNNYSGDPVSLASMSGKVFVMAFWNPG